MKLRQLITTVGVIVISLTITSQQYLNAQSDDGINIGHAPTSEYLQVLPGEVYEKFFTVWNLGDTSLNYHLVTTSFRQADDLPGTAIPLDEEENKRDPYSASEWITLSTTAITLPPHKNIDIPYTITVPNELALGEYHAKIYLTSENPGASSNGAIAKTYLGSGPSLLLQVGDDSEILQSAELIKFDTNRYVYESSPVLFETSIDNTGNTHITPLGEIFITNVFGDQVDTIQFNELETSLLRGTSGTFETKWLTSGLISNGKILFGPMTAQLVSTYRTIDPGFYPITSETTFWIIPWKLILAIIAAIALIITGFKVKKGRKK